MTEPSLDALLDLALAAGREIMAVYGDGPIAVAGKPDGTPVTEADKRAEAVILAGLKRLAPSIPVVAEEEASAGRIPPTGETFFLVDPLDGTREFIARNGEFTVNIALIERGIPVLGVVFAPALGLIYGGAHAEAIAGTVVDFTIAERHPIRVRPASGPAIAVASRSHATPETDRWLAGHDVASYVTRGSSLKFCMLAAGEADIYPRFGRTMEWDTAAGDAVLRAAGGIVTRPDGSPFLYNKRNQADDVDFANCPFIAFGDPKLVARSALAPLGQ
ncbi:3'(2'),5'-bisphosphate nucleotidase CysQ [Devosia sp. 1566]|uniref:3'(2'),5'-bisphosphate nucleotidase CysQ n=1 Tax=Devosia sp. 1566 TaxID=2499144 RepID=UPI000FDB050C|nr:3'(2'),5'-bisphosphate nucleotidase CysQ [Devosia sp. 1566]